ncbi:MAG: cytochrome c family protein [Pelagibacteraceae bacterium]|jgi:cytochrome c|nr:cytochrome c family protein [Pelagibacteraceae bacterium]|tara:strand:+ start:13117 stop:13656 length:540 start_codon:yes stop_codon:yes gene_type:complete
MYGFEISKIIAAIILTIVIVLSINKLADVVFNIDAREDVTYKVTKVTETKEISKDDNKANSGNDIKVFMDLGSIDHGKTVAKKCIGCHSVSKGGGNKIGPALWGVIGRKVGSVTEYKYSKAMGGFGKNWNFEAMNNFLIKPKDYVKGNKMAFAGISKEKDRASLILYLNEQSDSPLPLP